MLGFLRLFGRAAAVQQLDEAFARTGVPRPAVPDALKLTMVRLLREAHGGAPDDAAAGAATHLVGFCMLGRDAYADVHGDAAAEAVDARLASAVAAGDSLDARLVLLTLHAGVIQESVVARHGLHSESADAG